MEWNVRIRVLFSRFLPSSNESKVQIHWKQIAFREMQSDPLALPRSCFALLLSFTLFLFQCIRRPYIHRWTFTLPFIRRCSVSLCLYFCLFIILKLLLDIMCILYARHNDEMVALWHVESMRLDLASSWLTFLCVRRVYQRASHNKCLHNKYL